MGAPATDTLEDWVAARDGPRQYFNATAVAFERRGVLLLGPPGSGKSSTALALLAHGATLISDDGVWLDGGTLSRPDTSPPLIEARHIGLLNAGPICAEAPLDLAVDLSRSDPERLPPRRFVAAGARKVELIRAHPGPTLVPALLHLLRHGAATP